MDSQNNASKAAISPSSGSRGLIVLHRIDPITGRPVAESFTIGGGK